MPSPQQLRDLYRFPGFAPWARIQDIEDDALVTAEGCDLITQATPKTVTEIEAVMAEGRA